MKQIHHVLVATDFDEGATMALDAAIAVARAFGAKLTLLHVVAPAPYALYAEGLSWPIEELDTQAQRVMDVALGKARAAYEQVHGAIRHGVAWESIVEAARVEQADLIVLGTHGRRGLQRALLGSVAEKVVRSSPVPVLTVPLAPQEG